MGLAACAGACVGSSADNTPVDASGMRGLLMTPALPKPDFTFTDTDGKPYNFRKETAGDVALLFLGYTNCPDVCPLHMANIGAAMKQVRAKDRAHVHVVFVTTDIARDTPERLRLWLNHFDSSFVGLRPDEASLRKLEIALHMPASTREEYTPEDLKARADAGLPPLDPDSAYGIGHSAMVLAFTADDSARYVYPNGIQPDDWVNDIPKLVHWKAP
jgi:protein SCO1